VYVLGSITSWHVGSLQPSHALALAGMCRSGSGRRLRQGTGVAVPRQACMYGMSLPEGGVHATRSTCSVCAVQ
jgi:hypothetical protein